MIEPWGHRAQARSLYVGKHRWGRYLHRCFRGSRSLLEAAL